MFSNFVAFSEYMNFTSKKIESLKDIESKNMAYDGSLMGLFCHYLTVKYQYGQKVKEEGIPCSFNVS